MPPEQKITQQQFTPTIRSDEGVVKYQLDVSAILDDFKILFLGLEFNVKKEKWEATGTPLMNKKGLDAIMIIIQANLNKSTFLSSFTNLEIDRKMKEFCKNVALLIATKYKAYGIDPANRNIILDIADNLSHAALKRSEDGMTMRIQGSGQSVKEVHYSKVGGGLPNPFKVIK